MSHWHSLLFKVIKDGTKLYFKTYMFYMFALHVFPCGPSVSPYCNLCTCLTQKWVYFLASIDFHEYYWVILLIYDFTLLFRLSTCWAAFFLICWSFFEAAGCNKRGERMEWSKLSGLETNSGGRIHPLYTEHVISRCYWNFLTFGDQ